MNKPQITIIIPVKPGGKVKALESLASLEYPADLVEVIVAEGRHPSRQRNRAASEARGEILYFLDDDSIVEPDILQRAIDHYRNPRVAAVGGPSLTPATDGILPQAFGVTFASFLGGGGVRNRYRKRGTFRFTRDNELILCNLSFRKEPFLASGGLDERLYPNEENELMDRLCRDGWNLVHDPDMAVTRSQRPTYKAYVKQLFGYGRGRAEQTRISGRLNLASLVPPLFLLYLLSIGLFHNPVYTLPLLCYAGAVSGNALQEAFNRKRPALVPLLMLTIPTLHLAYGAGMIRGLISPRYHSIADAPGEVTLRRVKI